MDGQWINIEEQFPKINERVIVVINTDCKYVRTAFYEGITYGTNEHSWCEFFDGYEVGNEDEVHTTEYIEVYNRWYNKEITQWMPLPETK